MKIKQRTDSQIELTLVTETRPRRRQAVRPYQRRRERAGWWFREMHRAVDEAMAAGRQISGAGEQPNLILLEA